MNYFLNLLLAGYTFEGVAGIGVLPIVNMRSKDGILTTAMLVPMHRSWTA